MSILTAKDEYITCPYVPAHQILLSRLQTHLVKCEKSFKDKGRLVECPFNSTHKVSELELKCHTNYLCPDRAKVDTFVCSNETESRSASSIMQVVVVSDTSESWDNDDDPTYNPEDHLHNKQVLIHKQCVPPAQRKEFRLLERQRFQQLDNINSASATTSNANKENRIVQPSRLPQTNPRSIMVKDEEPPVPLVSKMGGLSMNEPKASTDGFVLPRYAKGRGRGRLAK